MKSYSKKTIIVGILIIISFFFATIFFAINFLDRQLGFESNFTDAAEVFNGPLVIHPYLGFVNEYGKSPEINKFGFMGPEPLSKKNSDKVIIAIFGGSVAEIYYQKEKDNLITQLKTYPQFKDKQIEIYSIALGGFKQPQQLMALNYFLVLGGEFNIVINIDGFNEAALPTTNNIPNQVSSFFPRSWILYARKSLSIEGVQLLEKIEKHKEYINKIEKIFSYPIIKNFQSIKNWLVLTQQKKLSIENNKLTNVLNGLEDKYQALGPEKEYFSDEQIKENVINVWKESSIQMANLAKENDILYLHFLQPNQYLPNSKNLSDEEKHTAYNEKGIYKEPIETIYPQLIAQGINLKERGELFTDLSNLFEKIDETIYVDDCCHLNILGNKLLTDKLVEGITSNYQQH